MVIKGSTLDQKPKQDPPYACVAKKEADSGALGFRAL
jgi:hypothetical protein